MTPEQLAHLLELLADAHDWLEETDPGSLDAALVHSVAQRLFEHSARLIREGAR